MSLFSSWVGNILVFFCVIINNGNGYNLSIGKFIVFMDGIYVFFIIVNVYGSNDIYLDIVYNGLRKVRIMFYSFGSY